MADISKIITELNLELKQHYPNYKGLYLYGSRIKNDAAEGSDLDLVFVFDGGVDLKLEETIWEIVYNYDLKYDVVIDAKVYELQDIKNPITPFRETVRDKGRYYAV